MIVILKTNRVLVDLQLQSSIEFNTTEIDDDDNYDSEGIFELIKTFTDNPGKEIFFTFSHHNHDDYETETYDDGTVSESSTLNNRNGTYEMGLNYKYPINENVDLNLVMMEIMLNLINL